MCNAKSAMNNILHGPASEALERTTKRRRIGSQNQSMPPAADPFSSEDLFQSVTSASDEGFPSIGWNFDDDETDLEPFMATTGDNFRHRIKGTKRERGGLLRCKSFRQGLSGIALEEHFCSTSKSLETCDTLQVCNERESSLCVTKNLPHVPFGSALHGHRFRDLSATSLIRKEGPKPHALCPLA
ncbi:predicted protein [Phaeodactylum tricornutum CCAP 1055/1]|jgi:hypothetical protein|uniref:Uncharacterized protein n=1 Tax=Phaeodactylum tricornutum (strain CCAP 1055/1) TaxID=556484 RepID=B7G6Q1_PHATC|nr:predicted protein [Phaeodactylum tricornutum CCAP 1055/1]EEC45506.1 predicted protein [Phaeodactylum tricornutum CCAP 1055/1]|eukprot:XP_002182770.1 predicted protein [Phaeodactylum tricornutum CCAP 1055/1]